MKELFKSVIGYEGIYQVSNLGAVRKEDGTVLSQSITTFGYSQTNLRKNGKGTKFNVHTLVAMAFLGHEPDGQKGLVIIHDNNNDADNNLSNLSVVSFREALTRRRNGNIGAQWSKTLNKWKGMISLDDKSHYLGQFDTEKEASEAYQSALSDYFKDGSLPLSTTSSQYKGVVWDKERNLWMVSAKMNGKFRYIGSSKSEVEASDIYKIAMQQYNENGVVPNLKAKFSSKYKGVSFNEKAGKFVGNIRIEGKLVYLGTFTDELSAAESYKVALKNWKEKGINPKRKKSKSVFKK